jgi:F-type H+-transporting ATPase subunit b
MPQLDVSTFGTQLFWLTLCFVVLYLLMWRVALPRVADLLQERQERIDDDLRRAEALKGDAVEVLAAYEKTIADGQLEAQAKLRKSAERMAAESAERHAKFTEKLAAESEAAERRIDAAREAALANVRGAAVEVVQAAVTRLIDVDISDDEAGKAVAATMKERG